MPFLYAGSCHQRGITACASVKSLDSSSHDALCMDTTEALDRAAMLAASDAACRAAFAAAAPSSMSALNSFLSLSGREGLNLGSDPHRLNS
ncbi:hypothetical protein KIL84_022681 [Mauremys mutica]|uniref:Uncharacterized protein n=1 Tax=Mauremys mutica TaxID=74926 RepID=A0A9D3WQ63_9SAUR|nr:hypothetical protein KIL84_022681 [Mauremys mutica]